MIELSGIIKKRRLELGLTMLDVANAVGVSEATVSRWESGQISNMRSDRIGALSKVLKMSPQAIMGLDAEMGAKVGTYRKEAGLSVKELSEKSGVPEDEIIEYEKGKEHINIDYIKQIAEVLNLPMIYFWDLDNVNKIYPRICGNSNAHFHFAEFLLSCGYKVDNCYIDDYCVRVEVNRDAYILTEEDFDGLIQDTKDLIDIRLRRMSKE